MTVVQWLELEQNKATAVTLSALVGWEPQCRRAQRRTDSFFITDLNWEEVKLCPCKSKKKKKGLKCCLLYCNLNMYNQQRLARTVILGLANQQTFWETGAKVRCMLYFAEFHVQNRFRSINQASGECAHSHSGCRSQMPRGPSAASVTGAMQLEASVAALCTRTKLSFFFFFFLHN